MDAQYYKERLGFEPVNGNKNGHTPNGQHKLGNTSENNEGYEENLCKIKDERDAIQKKTFTKWVNKHLKKCGRHVRNLFVDLRDGKSLLGLLEVLSEERLPSQKGQLRFHQLQNVQVALDFLRFRKIKLVNIRAEDIVDGNPKLTLGLIWTIILHFQISDIVDGDDTVNVREALLRWAQKTTERYPGVRVSNFTSSWRDGLAFSAIIHRNRPDLIDWREVQQKTVQSRLDQAFHIVEQEYGVTKLLDPEDVDTNEPDEKSLITYVSSLYDIFPDPPTAHPLYDAAAEKSLDDYRQSARRLHEWIRKETTRWQQQSVSSTSTAELRQSLKESERFHSQQLPPKHDEKQRLVQQYMQLERSFHDVGKMNLEPELHVSLLERNWSQLVSIHQQFHRHCEDELTKQERLQKLADKIQHEIRTADRRLDTIKEHVDEEAHRVTKSRPRDVKQQCEKIDTELVRVEETIKVLFSDVSTLQEGRHPQAPALHRDVQQLHTKWMSVHTHMQDTLIAPLSKRLNENPDDMLKRLIESDENFRFLSECLDWVKEKLVHIHEAEYGHDLHSCQEELELHHKEHKIIDQFQVNLDRCVTARKEYDDDELTLYMRLLSQLQKSYADLLSSSNKRLSDLMILHDFVQGATAELIWLNEKEEVEVGRDWSNRNQDLRQVDAHYEQLMSELERRERQFTAVQEQGMSLISQQHPASKTVEAYMGAMQTQWSWLLQLTLCLETHLKHAQMASQLFQDVDAMSHTIKQQDERLNGEFSVSEFTLDEGEQLLREMQELRDVMAQQGDVIQQLETRANQVTPQKQRRQATPTGQKVTAVCNYKNNNVSVRKQDDCTLLDNSSPDRWTVRTPAGVEAAVPSVCFLLPPPDREALEAVEQLKRQYEMSVTLWQRKQLRMRQNMIFATIKVVKGWDLQQFVAMGSEQRDAIRRALNEDAEKLIREGDPNDGQLRRLRREIDEVNRLFDEFERLAAEASPTNQFHTKIAALETEFEKAEGELKELCVAPIPREITETERLIRNHKDWQNRLQRHESTLEEVQSIYDSLSKKTPTMQSKLEKVIGKWDSLWTTSHSYIERLKCVEATLGGLEETQTVVSRLETRLNDYRQLPDDKDGLKSAHLELVDLQNSLHKTQVMVEQLNEDALKVRKLTERTRPRQRNHADVERLEEDVNRVTKRFTNCCQQVVDRLRAVDQAADLLSQYEQKEMMNRQWALQMEADAERARKAVVEKYKQCGTSIAKLLTWIAEVERRLANQEQVQEDVSSLRNQINVVKAIKDELKDEQRTVSTALDQVQDVVEKGNDILSKDEIKQLQTNAQELRQRYDTVSDHTDVLLRRLSLCLDELNKYKTDLHTFQSWLSIAERTLAEKERHMADLSKLKASEQGCREFVNDVIAHQADLRFITVAAQRFIDESKSFLKTLNDVRTNLPQRLRHIEPHKYNVKLEVDQVTKVFQSLLARGHQLLDRLTALAGRQRDYEEALERAARWLREIEPRAQQLLEEPVASEPRQVQEQLSRARLLSTDLLSNGKLMEAAGASAEQLVRQLSEGGHQLSARQQQQIQRPPAELTERHGRLRDAVDARCQALDAALVQSQGVHDSLDSLNGWLQEAEARLKALLKPASLVRQRLSEQQHEQRLLQADIDQHRSSVDKLRSAAAQMTPGGGRHGGVGTSLQDATARFDRLQAACKDRGRFLQELAGQVDDFWTRAEGVQHWLLQQIELIDSQEVGMLNGDAYQKRIEEVGGQRDAKKSELQAVVGAGNGLVSKKDTTDSSTTRDKVKELEGLWRELEEVLGERLREGRTRSDSLSAYERMKEEVLRWLQRMESRIDGLEPVAVDMAILKRQGDEIKPLLKEHDSFAASIDKFNELGVQYDGLLHGDRVDGPSRRRISVTPKRSMSHGRRSVTSTLSPARKGSQERRGGSPGGSPFTTRRDPDAYTKLDDVSQIQNQLNEVSHRYELAGARLTDRQRDIDAVSDEVRRQLDQLRQLQQLLDKAGWREQLPATRDEADRQLRAVRQQLEDFMYEKQPLMDGLRGQTVELLRRHPGAPGAEALQKTIDELSQRWKQRLDQLKTAQQTLQDCREFFDLHEQLGGWLQAKEKMFAVLGPLSADPRLVHMQSQQVAVLRDEFANQHPTLQALNRCGKTVVTAAARDDPAAKKVEEKVRKTNDKWEELMAMLEDREQNLDAASGASRQFNESFSKLQRDLMRLGDAFDDMSTDRLEPHKKLQLLDDLQKQLDQLRPRLSELEALGEELCLVLTDPAAKTEVKDKLYQLGRQYNQLAKKMDYLRAELDSSLKEDQEFENSCADVQDWMKACFNQLAKPLKVSADRTKLTRQLNEYEPFYKSIMAREHEVFLLQRKGSDLLAKTPNKQESKELEKFLDHLQKNWEALKQDAVGRLTQLQTCMDLCKKYHSTHDHFLPWLKKAEDKLQKLPAVSFKKADIQKQVRDLQTFRNEVSLHSSEYEQTVTTGDSLLQATDLDKTEVQSDLQKLRQRWEALGSGLTARHQALDDVLARVADFSDGLQDLEHGLQRCEDKLTSQDGSRDPRALERCDELLGEADKLTGQLQRLRKQADDLCGDARRMGSNADHLRDEVDRAGKRLNKFKDRLDSRHAELSGASQAVGEMNERVKRLYSKLAELEEELDGMGPVARTVKIVEKQVTEITYFMEKVVHEKDELDQAERSVDNLAQEGFTQDDRTLRNQLGSMRRQLSRIDDRGQNRQREVNLVLTKLTTFYRTYELVIDDIEQVSRDEADFPPLGSDVTTIRRQQQQFKEFKSSRVETLSVRVDDCNRSGQGLIQSASTGVTTAVLEGDLESMNQLWNELQERIHNRERALDVGLLQSGKFREALEGLLQWLADTEDMVAHQKPASADYKVVKAQVQEQKFLRKLLLDRQGSVSSLAEMGREIAANCSPAERADIDGQLTELIDRFDALNGQADERMRQLEDAMKVAKEYQDMNGPLVEWLEKMEKRLKDMEIVPTDEEKIQKRIKEHEALHDGIVGRRGEFDQLADVATVLMELVGDDEAAALADRLQQVTDRYQKLVADSDALARLLRDAGHQLRTLVLNYEDFLVWMDEMEQRLNKYRVLSVHVDKLHEQMEELTDLSEEVDHHRGAEQDLQDVGAELMKHITNEEALQLKDKLDSVSHRYSDLETKAASLLKNAQEVLPLVHSFHSAHNKLSDWLVTAEQTLQSADSMPNIDETMEHLMQEVQDYRPVVERLNQVGPQLCQVSPGEGAQTIEGLLVRDNRRYESIVEQVQRKSERLRLAKLKNSEVLHDIDDLLDWFKEVETQVREADPPSSDPDVIRIQLKEHKALNDDVASQKGRVRDVLSSAKRLIRDAGHQDDVSDIREKSDDLKDVVDSVSKLSSDRLSRLEQALPLAEHFFDAHHQLTEWLDEAESEAMRADLPALRADQILRQQERNKALLQGLQEHKPLLDKLNKTSAALVRLCSSDEAAKVSEITETDNVRYNALRTSLRERQQALEEALQECSQFSDKLDSMLTALKDTADQVNKAEPISVHPDRIQDQMAENNAIIDDLEKRESALKAVRKAADDVIHKAGDSSDPAVRDIKNKLDSLNKLWNHLQKATDDRGRSLDEALAIAEKFWSELHSVMKALKDLQDTLTGQEPPAVEPDVIKDQQQELQEIRHEIDQTKPEVEQVRRTGQHLMKVCGEPEKPEVRKNLADLGSAWDNITALYARREENLIDAMEKAMEFHDTMQRLLEFLESAEQRLDRLGPIGSDIDAVKKQIKQLMDFKNEVDPQMVKVETLNRQAHELMERTSPDQAAALRRPISEVNTRWDDLLKGLVERQRELDQALLRLGQFQHALDELLVWIGRTDKTLDSLKPNFGDPQLIEVELAKLKVTVNDMQAHQTSVDTLNDAGRQLIEADRDSVDAGTTHRKLNELNDHWQQLQEKAVGKQQALEKVLRDAHDFMTEIQDLLFWLNDLDGALTTSKPVGGLPETAKEQLERFMELFTELEDNRAKVNAVLSQGDVYLKSAKEGACTNMKHNLKTLKQRWDHVMNRANDKKIKLEIALKEATEFQDTLEQFIEWLNSAEKTLSAMQPVSRIMDNVIKQIDEHKDFQKAVSAHRECMLNLEKKGNHLKYFSQKQDVILIKNMLVSVQHRWERVVSKSADRTRALDVGYKEAKEFDDSWCELCGWLDEALHSLDDTEQSMSNNPDKVRVLLEKHKEFQGALGSRQSNYDAVMKLGRLLIKEKAPKVEEPLLREMLDALKDKWNSCCNKSVARQRKLEEALLFSGQFKEALAALLDWLRRAHGDLKDDVPVHGDLDTVSALCEHQKAFEQELEARVQQVESVQKTGAELARKADKRDSDAINAQVSELTDLWTSVVGLSDQRGGRLKSALRDAERLHKAVHMLLEWLSDAEMRLRFVGALPESEDAALQQAEEHARFMQELSAKETDKDSTLDLAGEILSKAHPDAVPVIRHWQTIIQSRWEEVSSWALQRQARLDDHVTGLKDLQQLLDELVRWVRVREQKLVDLEPVPLPDDLQSIELLVQEHQEFMEDLQSRQNEVDRICRPKHRSMRKSSRPKSQSSPDREMTPGKRSGETPDGDPQREYDKPWLSNVRATSPGRERSPDSQWARIGPVFSDMPAPGAGSRKGSRMSVSEPLSKSPLHRELWDAWRGAWMLAWERQRRLQDKLSYARELDKLQNFDFEEWRKRFMKYANQKKLRITDLFRRMDTDNDGFLEKFEFSDGIIKTNFPTSKLEMQMVADLVDRNQDGLIDYNEFMSALKPDWEKNRPLTDAEKIDDEVQKACSACTCRSKFKVFQVGEGKYRFGDSQKLRLVRILRSTVMVRVGGGWEALDEFLVKNDPCRAKGRTNVELREQFILAPGVSQSMAHFKSKRDASSPASRSTSVPTAGPITKVREKTGRSIPLSRASVSGGGDYGSSTEGRSTGGGGFSLRKGSTPARSSSSQGGSRPPSRAGSEISLDSVDGRPTAGYQQRNASGSSRLPTYRKGSTTPRGLATTPVSLSGRSPSSDGFSMQRRMPRRPASVTAMSSGSTAASRSRIPLLTRADTSDSIQPPSSRATTPAGRPRLHRTSSTQSIPASLNNTRRVREPSSSKIVRRSSGAADTARGQARKSATTERPRWH